MTVTIDGTSGITYPAGTIQGTGYGPAFSAYASVGTSTTQNTFTKLTFDQEEYDTANCFASSRFTPNVAGYYYIIGSVSAGYATQILSVYKNGSEYKRGTQVASSGAYLTLSGAAAYVYLNGSTDYIELYWWQGSSGTQTSGTGQQSTYFQGAMVRGA